VEKALGSGGEEHRIRSGWAPIPADSDPGVPGLPIHTPLPFVFAALAVSVVVGLASGVLPARRAAALDPVEALHAE
jgi:ABC-type antimicrobial peptide transport system permease subunit